MSILYIILLIILNSSAWGAVAPIDEDRMAMSDGSTITAGGEDFLSPCAIFAVETAPPLGAISFHDIHKRCLSYFSGALVRIDRGTGSRHVILTAAHCDSSDCSDKPIEYIAYFFSCDYKHYRSFTFRKFIRLDGRPAGDSRFRNMGCFTYCCNPPRDLAVLTECSDSDSLEASIRASAITHTGENTKTMYSHTPFTNFERRCGCCLIYTPPAAIPRYVRPKCCTTSFGSALFKLWLSNKFLRPGASGSPVLSLRTGTPAVPEDLAVSGVVSGGEDGTKGLFLPIPELIFAAAIGCVISTLGIAAPPDIIISTAITFAGYLAILLSMRHCCAPACDAHCQHPCAPLVTIVNPLKPVDIEDMKNVVF